MSMIGATLEDLDGLAQQLGTTTGDISTVSSGSVNTTSQVVDQVRSAAQAALQQITAHMDQLRQTVSSSRSRADGANWTGVNRGVFVDAYARFDTAMGQAESTTKETFADFDQLITKMSDELREYVDRFRTAMGDAGESTTSMRDAVTKQRQHLDEVMNSGLTVG